MQVESSVKIVKGQRIVYKGDMANIDGKGAVVALVAKMVSPGGLVGKMFSMDWSAGKLVPVDDSFSYDVALEDGRMMRGIYESCIGGEFNNKTKRFMLAEGVASEEEIAGLLAGVALKKAADEAAAKAKSAAVELEVPLETASADEIRAKLNEIMRATAEQLAAREAARLAREAEWAAMRAEREAEDLANIEEGVVSFGAKGRHGPRRLEDMDPGYLEWVVRMEADFEPGSKMRRLAEVIRTKFAHLLPRKPDPAKFTGTPGKRQVFKVEVSKVIRLSRPAYGAPWRNESVFIVTMIAEDGACLVAKGGSFYPAQGSQLTIKATVKDHDWYGDQAQTIVQRVVVLDDEEKVAA